MKKCVALFLLGVMLVSMIPILGATNVVAAQADSNLIVGGDFNDADRGLGYFKADYETDSLVYLPNGGADGSGCLGILMQQKSNDGNGANICLRYDDGNGYSLPLYPGNTYTMSCKVKKPSQSGNQKETAPGSTRLVPGRPDPGCHRPVRQQVLPHPAMCVRHHPGQPGHPI